MFTGIIEAVSEVTKLEKLGAECRLTLKNPFGSELKNGDSVAVDGVCLTVERFSNESVSFFVSKSTLEKTVAAKYVAGSVVNLERAMAANGRFDGHIVQGHVDSAGKVVGLKKIGFGIEAEIEIDSSFSDFVVSRGSITLNGVSLTIAELSQNIIKVSLIPETLNRTSFSKILKQGLFINVEFDILGKYVSRIVRRGENSAALESLMEKL